MKAVLMSIKPKWCEKIFSGEKTVEVRKTAPKLKPPYKVYVYCTKEKEPLLEVIKDGDDLYGEIYHGEIIFVKGYRPKGKVIGEFVCDRVNEIKPCFEYYADGYDIDDDYLSETCLTQGQLREYGNGKPLYGWHITKVKLYDKPKDIKEFRKPCPYGDLPCTKCPKCRKDKSGYIQCFNTVNHPPQSWCYVVEE